MELTRRPCRGLRWRMRGKNGRAGRALRDAGERGQRRLRRPTPLVELQPLERASGIAVSHGWPLRRGDAQADKSRRATGQRRTRTAIDTDAPVAAVSVEEEP